MVPHQQRVVDEKTELDEKISKLVPFIDGDIYKTLPEDEQSRLRKQVVIMADYSEVLGERIAAFPASVEPQPDDHAPPIGIGTPTGPPPSTNA